MKNLFYSLMAAALLAGCSGGTESSDASDAGGAVQHVNAKEAAELLQSGAGAVVLDIRTPEEFESAHIPGAKNIDFQSDDFESELSELDPEGTYMVHCMSGGRSKKSLNTFSKVGLTNVYHLDGGIRGWTETGHPVVQ